MNDLSDYLFKQNFGDLDIKTQKKLRKTLDKIDKIIKKGRHNND